MSRNKLVQLFCLCIILFDFLSLIGQDVLSDQLLYFENEEISNGEYYDLITTFNLKSANNSIRKRSIYTHKIDSIVAYKNNGFNNLNPTSKAAIIFDDNNLKEVLVSWRIENENRIPNSYSVFHYNKKDLIKKRTYNLWSGQNEDWLEDNAQIIRHYEYDEENRLVRYYSQDQADVALGKFSIERIYQYDSIGLLTKIVYYSWNDGEPSKTNSSIILFKHNQKQLLSETINLKFNLDRGWEYNDSTIYSYNNKNLLEREVFYTWAQEKGFFKLWDYRYNYNENNRLNEIKYYTSYYEPLDIWLGTEFEFYEYHDYGSLNNVTRFDSIDFFPYGLIEKETMRYKHNKEVDYENIKFHWLKENGSGLIRHEFENHMLLEQDELYWDNYEFDLSTNVKFYYSEITTSSTEEPLKNAYNITVSPNPAQDILTIDIEDYNSSFVLNIFNANGMLVLDNTVHSKEQISVSDFDEGIYFYTVLVKGEVKSGRFVVLR